MRSVLLVDDDAPILAALKKALRAHRDWKVETANSAPAALELLAQGHFDAVITDALMPEMTGEALLEVVSAKWPTMLRVVLSGQVRAHMMDRLTTLSQQVVPKPTKPGALYALVEHALQARARLNPELAEIVGRLGRLPAQPSIYPRLSLVLADERSTSEDVARILQQDPGLTANLLRLVNSPWFAPLEPITSLRQAIKSLGVNPLRSLVMTAGLFGGGSQLSHTLIQEAVARGLYVEALSQRLGTVGWKEAARTTAVVCDIARLVLEDTASAPAQRCRANQASGTPRLAAEREAFGADHALIGAAILGQWGLPEEVTDAVAHHHSPPLIRGAASAIALAAQVVEPSPGAAEQLDELAQVFGLTPTEAKQLGPSP